jgi:hypothetical protein
MNRASFADEDEVVEVDAHAAKASIIATRRKNVPDLSIDFNKLIEIPMCFAPMRQVSHVFLVNTQLLLHLLFY